MNNIHEGLAYETEMANHKQSMLFPDKALDDVNVCIIFLYSCEYKMNEHLNMKKW